MGTCVHEWFVGKGICRNWTPREQVWDAAFCCLGWVLLKGYETHRRGFLRTINTLCPVPHKICRQDKPAIPFAVIATTCLFVDRMARKPHIFSGWRL